MLNFKSQVLYKFKYCKPIAIAMNTCEQGLFTKECVAAYTN